jgi:hypothetical protein
MRMESTMKLFLFLVPQRKGDPYHSKDEEFTNVKLDKILH